MRRGTWLGAYALATFLAFPHPLAGWVVDLGLLFAWIAPACLLLGLEGLTARRAAGVGFVAGLVAHSAVLHWIYVVTVTYGHAPLLAGLAAPVGLAAYIAAFTALFAAGYTALARRRLGGPLSAALLWTVLDHGRAFVLTGFPWATLGYAQHDNPALVGLAALTGVYGLSFTTVLAGAGVAWWAHLGRDAATAARPTATALAVAAGVVALHGIGLATRPAPPEGPPLRIGVVQGNIDQAFKWSRDWAERTLAVYEGLTRDAVEAGAQLVVWPETALPGSPDVDSALRGRVEALARETGVSLVVGAVGIDPSPEGWRYYDSAFVLDPAGQILDRYDKTHLVPFGEYVPLRDWLGSLLSAVASGIAPGDVTPGSRPRALSVVAASAAALPLGVPICYELLFPDLMRRFVDDGAGALLAITNDAWYGRTGAPYQFLAITALRSAENGVWTARAANTGVSAFIDERGRVVEQTPIFERGFLVRDVPLRSPDQGRTFYTRHGDVFVIVCWLGLAGLAAAAVWRRGGQA